MNDERFADELYFLISTERRRRLLKRCADGPVKLSAFVEGPSRDQSIEQDLGRMRVLGLLDGGKKRGWTLVAKEVLDLIAAIRRAHTSANVWKRLRNRTFRAVLGAMLGPGTTERFRSEFALCGTSTEVTNALNYLEALEVAEQIDEQRKIWRRKAHATPWLEVLARGQLLVHVLLHEPQRLAAMQAFDTLTAPDAIKSAYRAAPVVPRTAMSAESLDHIFGAAVEDRERREGLRAVRVDHSPIWRLVPARRTQRSEMLDWEVIQRLYADDPHALTLIFGALFELDPEDAAAIDRALRYLAEDVGEKWNAIGPPTTAQLRGRRRREVLRAMDAAPSRSHGGDISIDDLELPNVYLPMGPEPQVRVAMQYAARYLSAENRLVLNPHWTNLASTAMRFPDEVGDPDVWRIQNYLRRRHALRLVERVLLHDNYVADLPDGISPELSDAALTAAAHWNTVEVRDARRVVNGFLSSPVDPYAFRSE
jgi:hypothetical protein